MKEAKEKVNLKNQIKKIKIQAFDNIIQNSAYKQIVFYCVKLT